jgi:hypothetical protein
MNNNYVAVVAFDTDKLDPEGNPKQKKSKFLIPGVTLFDAQNTLMEYLKTDSRGWDVKSIAECKYEDILEQSKAKSKLLKMD